MEYKLLTTCASCAAPIPYEAPQCKRCATRYCSSTCQHDHWRRGHKQICKKIHRGGNAEQYNADKKYKEAVAVAAEACADGSALVNADGATLDDLREAVTTLEDAGRTARRVLGGHHPMTARMEQNLPRARAALRARETPSPPGRQA